MLGFAFQNTDRSLKLGDITREVVEKLSALCPDCGVTQAIIDKQAFLCYPESPSYVTYRARLEGTSEVESGHLISLIGQWVGDGSGIIVNEVVMKVDPKCSVAISDLGEEECIPVRPIVLIPTPIPTISMEVTNDVSEPTVGGRDDQPKTLTLTTTIGVIVVVVVLIITIATTIIIVIIAVLVLRNRRATYLLKNSYAPYVMFSYYQSVVLYTSTQEWFKREGRRCYQDLQQ